METEVAANEGADSRPVRPAATLLLVRDGSLGIEVLTVKRSMEMRTFPGFLAFPGGSVIQEDHQCQIQSAVGRVRGQQQIDDGAFAIAALRETAEEIGWFGGLIRDTGEEEHYLVDASVQSALLGSKFDLLRELEARHLKFHLDAIRFVGRWVTPVRVNIPVRFDARFFVMRGYNEELDLRVHQRELDWARWHQPKDLLKMIEEKAANAAYPTRAMLTALAEAPNVDWCLEHLTVGQPENLTLSQQD